MLLCFGAAWKMELWTNKKCEYYVSQKQNGFNNKIQWYSILLTFMFHRLSWTKIFVLSNLKNWQLSTWQYYKVGNCSIWGWPECDFSILGRVGGGGFHHNWDSRSHQILSSPLTFNLTRDTKHGRNVEECSPWVCPPSHHTDGCTVCKPRLSCDARIPDAPRARSARFFFAHPSSSITYSRLSRRVQRCSWSVR